MDEDLAEAPGEGLVPVDVELLVTKEDHPVVQQRLTDLADDRIVQILRHVDVANLGSQRAGDRLNFNMAVTHWRFLLQQTVAAAG